MKKAVRIYIVILTAIIISGCSNGPKAFVSINDVKTIEELVRFADVIISVDYIETEEIIAMENGENTGKGSTADDTACYAFCRYRVKEVLKGDEKAIGETLRTREFLGFGEEADTESLAETMTRLGERRGDPTDISNPNIHDLRNDYNEIEGLLLFGKKSEEGDYYALDIPRKCIQYIHWDRGYLKPFTTLTGQTAAMTIDDMRTYIKSIK